MNIRFSKEKIRFRIATAELDKLISGTSIKETVYISKTTSFEFTVKSLAEKETTPVFVLENEGSALILGVALQNLVTFKNHLAESDCLKEKIQFDEKTKVEIYLEVDLFDPKRSSK